MLAEPVQARDGYLSLPSRPGLGFELANAPA
jgi:L-alanine-DL-glutamate epimerase-like enolase superfamily enzyme